MYIFIYVPIYLFMYEPALEAAAPTVFTVWLQACEELVTCPGTVSDKI